MPLNVLIEGSIDLEKLESAFNKLIDRHESLRTSFDMIDEVPVQIVHKDVEFNIENIEADKLDLQDITEKFVKPFDLSKAPLVRVSFVVISQEKMLMLVDTHHIVSDGVSHGILTKDLLATL